MMENLKKKKTILKSVVVTLVAIAIVLSMLLTFSGCKKEVEEIPWWKDFENLEYNLYDERSEEKSFTYKRPYEEKIFFNYTLKSGEKVEEEFIPNIRILHKGVAKYFHVKIIKREWFFFKGDGYDYEDPHVTNKVTFYGGYRVELKYYLDPNNPDDLNTYVGGDDIYITVHKEGEDR